jgi:bifunctional DNase/RNase
MLVALLASVSAGIFAAHILDAFRTGQRAVDARPSHSASDRAALRSRRSPPISLQTPALLQSLYYSNSGSRLSHVNDRFAAQ